AQIWAQTLAIPQDRVTLAADFFQSGGHSLKATVLMTTIQQQLNVKVPLVEIFKTPTIDGLARFIKENTTFTQEHITPEPVEQKEYYPLSPAQKRLYILQQMNLESVIYNMPEIIALPKQAGKEKLEHTFRQLIHRHESLRTSFHLAAGTPVQQVHGYRDISFFIDYYGAGPGSGQSDQKGASTETL
ncbi:MAG: hypothetical protein GY940_11245, partial [bacterium]|nr:hypothetical protein [bacterium]